MNLSSKKHRLKPAYSLLEIIFVVVLIGIIASVSIPKLMETKSSAVVSTIKQDITTLTSSIQTYYIIHGKIDNITDAVKLNTSFWEVDSLEAKFSDNDKECIIASIIKNDNVKKLSIDINEDGSEICNQLVAAGVEDSVYELY